MTVFLLLSTPIRYLIRPLLYKPGQGPSPEFQERGWFKTFLIADAEDGEQKVFCFSGKGDPGYKSTAKLVCEAAIALLDVEKLPEGKKFGGVLTSAVALGMPYLQRLKEAGISMQVLK